MQNGASTQQGKVLVSDHIPKVKVSILSKGTLCLAVLHDIGLCQTQAELAQDFFQKDCWRHHPKPYADYMELKQRQDQELAASKKKLIPGLA